MKTQAPPKLNVKINYAGREVAFRADPDEQVIVLRTRAMDRFKIHADRDALGCSGWTIRSSRTTRQSARIT